MNRGKNYALLIVLLVAVPSVSVVWVQIFQRFNELQAPIIQGVAFSGSFVVIGYLVSGCPTIPKPIFLEKFLAKIKNKLPKRKIRIPVSSTYEEMNPNVKNSNRSQYYSKRGKLSWLLSVSVVFGLFIFMIWAVYQFILTPEIPVTSDKVSEIIYEHGYEPQNITSIYCEKDPAFKPFLRTCVAFEEDDIHFEFFEFNNENSALDVYRQARHMIIEKHNAYGRKNSGTWFSNYAHFWKKTDGQYSVTIYLGNTAVYAYSKSENMQSILEILEEIDYIKP